MQSQNYMKNRYERAKEQTEKKLHFLRSQTTNCEDIWQSKLSSFHNTPCVKLGRHNEVMTSRPDVVPQELPGEKARDDCANDSSSATAIAGVGNVAVIDQSPPRSEFSSHDFLAAALSAEDAMDSSPTALLSATSSRPASPSATSSRSASSLTTSSRPASSLTTSSRPASPSATSSRSASPIADFIANLDTSFLLPEVPTISNESTGNCFTIRDYRASTRLKCRPTPPTVLPSPVRLSLAPVQKKAQSNLQLMDVLLNEASILEDQVGQGCKAVEFCRLHLESKPEELVEAERVLLIKTLCQEATMSYIKALHLEETQAECTEKATIRLTNIVLPLKDSFVQANENSGIDTWFLCIVTHNATVVASNATRLLLDGCIVFSDPIYMPDVQKDFTISLKVYSMRLKRVEQKSISPKTKVRGCVNRMYHSLKRKKSNEVVVDSSSFRLSGCLLLNSLDFGQDIPHKLTNVPLSSPLCGSVRLSMKTYQLELCIVHEGFLNMLEKHGEAISWTLMWCRLVGCKLRYWDTARIQPTTPPTGEIDLKMSLMDTIGSPLRSLCPRQNTVLIQVVESAKPNAQDTLVELHENNRTIVRYFLNAASKEEHYDWCRKLNSVLSSLTAFGARKCKSSTDMGLGKEEH